MKIMQLICQLTARLDLWPQPRHDIFHNVAVKLAFMPQTLPFSSVHSWCHK